MLSYDVVYHRLEVFPGLLVAMAATWPQCLRKTTRKFNGGQVMVVMMRTSPCTFVYGKSFYVMCQSGIR